MQEGAAALMRFFAYSNQPIVDVVYLGGSITNGAAASDVTATSWRALTSNWLGGKFASNNIVNYNKGIGSTGSWYGLVRLQADVLANSPDVVFIDFGVNDTSDVGGDRTNEFMPTAEALIRRIKSNNSLTKIIVLINTWVSNYSYLSETQIRIRDNWITLANHYDLDLYRWDTYVESLMGEGYTDLDFEAYLFSSQSVHPNDAGHQVMFDLIKSSLSSLLVSSYILPDRHYAESEDFEQTPTTRTGVDNDGETGAGWSTDGTARISSTADDTISWTGTFSSFGLDTNYSTGAGTLAWSIDGGAYTNIDLSLKAGTNFTVTNFTRSEHTVTIKVISGTVEVKRFLAI